VPVWRAARLREQGIRRRRSCFEAAIAQVRPAPTRKRRRGRTYARAWAPSRLRSAQASRGRRTDQHACVEKFDQLSERLAKAALKGQAGAIDRQVSVARSKRSHVATEESARSAPAKPAKPALAARGGGRGMQGRSRPRLSDLSDVRCVPRVRLKPLFVAQCSARKHSLQRRCDCNRVKHGPSRPRVDRRASRRGGRRCSSFRLASKVSGFWRKPYSCGIEYQTLRAAVIMQPRPRSRGCGPLQRRGRALLQLWEAGPFGREWRAHGSLNAGKLPLVVVQAASRLPSMAYRTRRCGFHRLQGRPLHRKLPPQTG